jgi:hypothetical protein
VQFFSPPAHPDSASLRQGDVHRDSSCTPTLNCKGAFMFKASNWFAIACVTALAASAHAGGGNKGTLVPSPHGSGYTVVSGTGPCADVTFSGERRGGDFHVESITNRPCRAGEAAGSRTYTQTNQTGPGAAGQRPLV